MGSLRLNLRGHLDTVLLRSDGRRFWSPMIAAANSRFSRLDRRRSPARFAAHFFGNNTALATARMFPNEENHWIHRSGWRSSNLSFPHTF
jgi:hypothetical protein